MLTYRQLDDLPDAVITLLSETEQSIINDMARRIARMGEVTAATNWQMMRLEALGAEQDYIIQELSRALGTFEHLIVQLFDEAATRALKNDDRIYRAAGYDPVPLSKNPYLQQIIFAGMAKTNNEFTNLTRTTANTASMQFEHALDLAHMQIVSGAMDYRAAVKAAIRSLAARGLAAIAYPSGHVDYLDVAARRAVLTGVNQTAAELQLARMDEMGTDLVETTAHAGARTDGSRGPSDHEYWQGQIFSRSGAHPVYPHFATSTGYGTGPGLCGWNCRHSFFPFFDGLSDPAYTAERLREYNNRTATYNGRKMTLYDATQHQRYIERQIRRWKRESSATDAAGLDNSYARDKVREWQAIQRDFMSQTGLRRDYFRERAGKQNLEAASKNDIIKAATEHIKRVTGIRGILHLTPSAIDDQALGFDDYHINTQRGHNVTVDEAKSFIRNAKVSVTRMNGMSENYFSYDGAAYVDIVNGIIRTAFKCDEYTDAIKRMLDEVRKYEQSGK